MFAWISRWWSRDRAIEDCLASLDASVRSLQDQLRTYDAMLRDVSERSRLASVACNTSLEKHRYVWVQVSDHLEKLSEAQDSDTERLANELAYAEKLDRKASAMNGLLDEMNQALKAMIAAKEPVKKASRVKRVKRASK